MTKIMPEHLARRACVYIRQSTADQLLHNQESQRRQYGLADRARALGWRSYAGGRQPKAGKLRFPSLQFRETIDVRHRPPSSPEGRHP
jgi:hypothetical protein